MLFPKTFLCLLGMGLIPEQGLGSSRKVGHARNKPENPVLFQVGLGEQWEGTSCDMEGLSVLRYCQHLVRKSRSQAWILCGTEGRECHCITDVPTDTHLQPSAVS